MINRPIRVPIVYTKSGDTLDFPSYTFYDGNNVALDLSSWTFTAQWLPEKATLSIVPLDVDDSLSGEGKISVSASSTTTLMVKTAGSWELIATHNVSGDVKTILFGKTQEYDD